MRFILIAFAISSTLTLRAQSSSISFPEMSMIGHGKDTLLVIGCLSCRWNLWESFMKRNSDRYTVISVTLPGFAGAILPTLPIDTDKPVWTENAIDQLKLCVDKLKIRNLTVVGHSWGALVAVQFAARYKSVVKRIINVDGMIDDHLVPEADSTRLRWARTVAQLMIPLSDPQEWFMFNYVNPTSRDSISRTAALQYIRLVAGFTATDKVALRQYWRDQFFYHNTQTANSLTVPILDIKCLMGKRQDSLKLVRLSEIENAKFKKNVTSVFFFNTNHFPMIDRPDWIDNLFNDFINNRKLKTEFGKRI